MIEVTVNAQVAFSRIDGGGTRRVRCADGTVHVFSRYPQLFAELPPEVAADPYLTKRTVAEVAPLVAADAATGAPGDESTGPSDPPPDRKKGDRVQIAGLEGVVDLEEYDYPALVKLAKDLGVDCKGKKEELRQRLREFGALSAPVTPATLASEGL